MIFLHTTTKEEAQFILCTNIKPSNIINIKCALRFCDEWSKYITTGEEIYDGPNHPLIQFGVYTYQGICENMVWFKMDQLYVKYVNKITT